MKILVALSGGLDSAAAVLLLQKEGFDVNNIEALFIDMNGCKNSIQRAKNVANMLGLRLHVARCEDQFKECVVGNFADQLKRGKTPSGCAFCNPNFKFKVLDQWAEKLQCDMFATGHYINKVEVQGKYYLKKGVDNAKDQSYFLWGLSQFLIQKAIFPLGRFKKSEVKDFLDSVEFQAIAQTKESMSLCFIPKGLNYNEFVRDLVDSKSGDIVDCNGNIVGRHNGFALYTLGQKRGFELFESDKLAEVVRVEPHENRVVVSFDPRDLYVKQFFVTNLNIVDHNEFFSSTQLIVVVRGLGRNPSGYCTVEMVNNTLKVICSDDLWAVTPGQSAVFYIDDRLVGGGEII